jgi:hypothetical protein
VGNSLSSLSSYLPMYRVGIASRFQPPICMITWSGTRRLCSRFAAYPRARYWMKWRRPAPASFARRIWLRPFQENSVKPLPSHPGYRRELHVAKNGKSLVAALLVMETLLREHLARALSATSLLRSVYRPARRSCGRKLAAKAAAFSGVRSASVRSLDVVLRP